MNIKESIISSFFSHLILLLLVVAISNYTTGFQNAANRIITLDLSSLDDKIQPDELPMDERMNMNPPLESAATMQDETIVSPAEEQSAKPAPEEKKEPVPQQQVKESVEKPDLQKDGFSSMEAYYQFIIVHKRMFKQQAGTKVNALLGEAFKVNKREFFGGTAVVRLRFGPDNRVNDVFVDATSAPLKAFFEEIVWDNFPSPSSYSLGYKTVVVEFAVQEGYMSFDIKAL